MNGVHKVCPLGKGFLAVRARPVASYLEEECQSMADNGLTMVVSLLEAAEARRLGLQDEQQYCQQAGLRFISHPVIDHGLPVGQSMLELASRLHGDIRQGEGVVIHCFAGIGRTGMLSSCVLMAAGYSADDATLMVSQARGVSVPETERQMDWIYNQEAYFAQFR